MTSAPSSISNSNLLSSYITQSQQATTAAEAQMANNVSNGTDASGAASSTSTAASALTGNFNTFLKILTTQLQNQDPTSPMDTNQFTQELVEFSGVEQQLNTNSLLTKLVSASGAGGVKSLLGYVGQYVEAPANNQLLLQNGAADLSYTLPSPAQSVTLTVTDSTGNTVATLNAPTASGVNNITWNGQDSSGNQLADGVYSLSLVATDSGGNAITPSAVNIIGQVTGVQTADSSGNDLMLGPAMTINDANITAVFSASSMAASTSTSTSSSSG